MAKKLTTPQVKALRLCAVDQFGQYGGQHVDGMVTKALMTRGLLDSDRVITSAGRAALGCADPTYIQALQLRQEFDNAGWWHEGRTKACRRFCGDQHEEWIRDEQTGTATHRVYHHTSLACCWALVEAGKTWEGICRAFS